MEINEKLKDLRTFKNLSTYDLAKKVGIPQSTISKLENGNRKIDIDILQKISNAMNVPIAIFFQKQSPSEILGKKITVDKLKEWDDENIKKNSAAFVSSSYLRGKLKSKLIKDENLKTINEAMKFILEQPVIMSDLNLEDLSDEDKINFSNDLYDVMKLLAPKYKK